MKTFIKIKKILLFSLIIFISHTIIASADLIGSSSVIITVGPAPISGSCSDTHYSCDAGTPGSQVESSPYWLWGCNGLNGGDNVQCSEIIPPPTNLTSSCTSGGTLASLSWTLPSGYTLSYLRVMDNYPPGTGGYAVLVPEWSADNGPSFSFASTPGHNYTSWVHTRLPSGASSSEIYSSFNCIPAPTGTLTASPTSCTIASGASSCSVPLTWTTTNPVDTSKITSNYPSANTALVVINNWSNWAMDVPYLSSPRTFYLYNNATLLAQTTATSSCVANTTWNGSVCALNTYTVSTSAGSGGSITPASRTGVSHGSTTTFTVTPNSGYSISSILGCGGSRYANNYVTGPITAACTVTATFSLVLLVPTVTTRNIFYYTQTTAAGGGNVTSNGGATVTVGGIVWSTSANPTTALATKTVNSNWADYSTWGDNMTGLTANTLYHVRAYATNSVGTAYGADVSFTTAINTYLVSSSAGAGGSITPASSTISHGSTTTFTVTPNSGYSIGSVSGCGGSLSGNTYTTGAITAACTVTATFGDSTPPSAPGIVTTSWIGDHYVNTNFVASTTGSTDAGSGIRGYRLCRSYDNGGGCQVWTTNGEHSGTSETVSGADLPSPGTYRYYYWYAYDNSGNQSTNSPAEYVRMDAISPTYNSTSFTGCNYESGNNCYVKNGTTFYVNISHTDNESGSNNQYFELSKNGANRGTWDGATGNIKSVAVPYGVSNGGYYTSYGEGAGMDGAGYLDIQNAQCIQSPNCNVTALGKWPVVAGSGASTMYGVTVYMYDQFYNGVGYTATPKYVYLDNDAPSIPTPTDDGVNVASPTLNFYASPSDASSGLSVCYAQIDVNNTDGAGLAMGTTAIGAAGNYSWTGSTGNTYYYRYYCTDRVGNSSGWSSWSDGVSISTIPTVTTRNIFYYTQTTATGGGNVTSNGGATVTVSGIVWSTSANPTTALATKTVHSDWADYSTWGDNMTGLTANTLYHVRAYATNSIGTAYGADISFTTSPVLLVPTVTTTTPVTSITQTTATGGGNVTSNGGDTVTVGGIIWSTSANPTIALVTKTVHSGWADYSTWGDNMTGLTANTTYYVRAYATNSVGTSYGSDVSFTTIGVTLGTIITASGCTVQEGESTCPSSLTWNTINPLSGIYSVIKKTSSTGTIIATGNSNSVLQSGTASPNITLGLTDFYLMHNGVPLDTKQVTAGCGGNHRPSGGICIIDDPGSTTTFTVNNVTTATIFKGKSATLRWDSPLATSCTGTWTNATEFGTWPTGDATSNSIIGVTVSPSPSVTTTYTLTCSNSTPPDVSIPRIVKVVNLNIEEN